MKNEFYATGRRKEAVARVWIKPESKKEQFVNGMKPEEYFCRKDLVLAVKQPLIAVELEEKTALKATVSGGGVAGQADALKLAIARALCKYSPELRATLKQKGFLTRDSRAVERKKYGHPKARKRFQFSKR